MAEVEKHPLLTPKEERELARQIKDEGSLVARERLIVSNLRFVVRVANQFRAYTQRGKYNILDLIQEGNSGLVHAAELYDYSRGYRFITYAVWWIKARIMSFIVRAHSMVRVGTTAVERKLFFKMGAVRHVMSLQDPAEKEIARLSLAHQLNTSSEVIKKMEDRIFWKDVSMEAPASNSAEKDSLSLIDFIADEQHEEEAIVERNLLKRAREEIEKALERLNPREKDIVSMRYLEGEGATLQAIAEKYDLSRERIRQIESKALRKLKPTLLRSEASKELMK